jgi:predicted ATPase
VFLRLQLEGWRQFRSVDVTFHPRLTVLTGANGAGKTSLLNLASRHFGWPAGFVSTPGTRERGAALRYSSDFWDLDESTDEPESLEVIPPPRVPRVQGPQVRVGSIEYSDGGSTPIMVPLDAVGSTYDVQLPQQRSIEGLHIPSHRPTYSYQQVQSIPTVPRRRSEVFQQYSNLVRTRYLGQHSQWSPHYYMKETLIALATFGYGNQAVEADPESARVFEDFENVLQRMLPPNLGFKRLVVRVPEVVLDTETGSFSLDALSGGAAAVVDLAWQIFMFQPAGTSFVVTLDEPENHLHPELQRRILTDLIAAFPSVQFIVATHSPFIVGSVPDSNVYVLDYDESRKVKSTLLDTVNKAGSANEILRDVLGLAFTMPVWVESRLEGLVERYREREFSEGTVAELRAEMESLGMGRLVPSTIARLAEEKDSA